jgi:hypothetical protein
MDGIDANATSRGDDQLREGSTVVGPAGSGIVAMRQAVNVLATQSQQMADSAKQLLSSAQSGGFGFQPEAADIMIKALQESLADLTKLNDKLILISQAPKLGRTPAAQWVSPFTQQVATDEQGIVRAIGNLWQILTDMIAAYAAAKQHYDETDTVAAQRMGGLHK